MDEKKLSASEVEAWLAGVRDDLLAIELKLKPLVEEQQRLQARESLLRDLLNSFGVPKPIGAAIHGSAEPRPRSSANGSVGQYVNERAMEILRDVGEPLHINELHTRFLQRGFNVPGAGRPANLIVHLRRSEEIVSPHRGIYGLVEQVGPVERKVARRRKKTTGSRRRSRKE